MNELMFANPRYYLAEMTGLSLLYWVRRKKHTSFQGKELIFFLESQLSSFMYTK